MDFTLNEEQRGWQMEARRFAQEEIRPISLARDRIAEPAQTIDWDIIRRGSRLGFRTAAVPREWGGHGIDFVTQVVVIAELARGDSAIAKTFSQNWKWCHLIGDRATPEQRERLLAPFLADDTYLLGGGITEPNAGSDNRLPPAGDPRSGLRLRAERRDGEWVLNGEKCYIAHANVGKLFMAYARTDPDAPLARGTSVFAVPIDTPGVRVGSVSNKAGWRFYQNAELFFENARVPQSSLLGEVNGGLEARGGKNAKFGELEYSANAVGVCDAAVEMGMACAKRERRGGRLLAEHQLVQLKLSEMHMYTEALRSWVLRLAAESDASAAGHSPHGHFLMNFATDAIQRVCYANLAVHRCVGNGEISAGAEKLVRDAIIWTHIAGDSVQRMKSVQGLLASHGAAREAGGRRSAAS
ncbi:MAG: acyl-CoA/acyl-ACP dehydrogenase [Burkholderiales bacterium]|nr:acyl-CoA/acyl-ACP dehydrogenase [Burkholderiales bacterium]